MHPSAHVDTFARDHLPAQQLCKATVAPYKYPRAIAFLDLPPRTETGKLHRLPLRQVHSV